MPIKNAFILSFCLLWSGLTQASSVDSLYRTYCAACHGAELQGGVGPSLVDDNWLYGNSAEAIANSIANGSLKNGMPPFKEGLSSEQIRGLVIYIAEQASRARPSSAGQLHQGRVQTRHHAFKLTELAKFSGVAWAVEQQADLSFLVTLREGELWQVNDKGQSQIQGLPSIWQRGQGGLLDLALYPEQGPSEWLYFSYSEKGGLISGMTAVARAKLEQGKLTQWQTLFQADSSDHTSRGVHFGSRLLFHDQHLYFSIGDRGQKERAQQLNHPNGKIHRLKLDGSLPADNPFPNAKYPSIWSYGHRNPQGLTLNPATGDIWSLEHGPRGGDELNLIEKGLNYGWPEITYGMNYDGTPMTAQTAQDGMEQPVVYWVPSLAVSALAFYQGSDFPLWKNQILVASLAAQELRLLTLEGKQVVAQETLLKDQGRIRDVIQGRDGGIYLLLEQNGGGVSRLVRMTPIHS